MSTVRELHRQAMVFAQEAVVVDHREGPGTIYSRMLRQLAAKLEREALAELERYVAETGENPEPTRRILTISAISLEHSPSTEDEVMRLYEEEQRGREGG